MPETVGREPGRLRNASEHTTSHQTKIWGPTLTGVSARQTRGTPGGGSGPKRRPEAGPERTDGPGTDAPSPVHEMHVTSEPLSTPTHVLLFWKHLFQRDTASVQKICQLIRTRINEFAV